MPTPAVPFPLPAYALGAALLLALLLAPPGRAQQPPATPTPAATPATTPTSTPPPPPPPALVVIEGRVVDMRGEGVPAAAVHACRANDATPLARTVADGEGWFRLARVPVNPPVRLLGTKEGFCIGAALAGATTRQVQIDLQHAATVRGVVRDAAGAPVRNAVVFAEPTGRALTYVEAETGTDEQGAFVLAAVPLAPMRFSAWIPGEGLAAAELHVQRDCEIALALDTGLTTTVDVVIEGLPADAPPIDLHMLPYVRGSLTMLPPPHQRPRATNGRWRMSLAPDWEYLVRPRDDAFVFAPLEHRSKPGQGARHLVFTATPRGHGSTLQRARAVGADGAPVANVTFALRAPNGGATTTATADADGAMTFASPLANGTEVVVYTTDPAWAVAPRLRADDPFASPSSRQYRGKVDTDVVLELPLVAACAVAGRVLLADGRPAPFVAVRLEDSARNRWPQWTSTVHTRTDRGGHFQFGGLRPLDGPVRIDVQGVAGSFTGEPFALAAAGTRHDAGELRLTAPAILQGVVRDAAQQPAPGIRVWLRDWDLAKGGQTSGALTETLTDRDGRYRFVGVPPGGAWLQVLAELGERPTSERAVEPFEVEAGKTYTHDLQLPAK